MHHLCEIPPFMFLSFEVILNHHHHIYIFRISTFLDPVCHQIYDSHHSCDLNCHQLCSLQYTDSRCVLHNSLCNTVIFHYIYTMYTNLHSLQSQKTQESSSGSTLTIECTTPLSSPASSTAVVESSTAPYVSSVSS